MRGGLTPTDSCSRSSLSKHSAIRRRSPATAIHKAMCGLRTWDSPSSDPIASSAWTTESSLNGGWGRRIHPIRQWGGLDVDYEWQIPLVEYWLRAHGVDAARENSYEWSRA